MVFLFFFFIETFPKVAAVGMAKSHSDLNCTISWVFINEITAASGPSVGRDWKGVKKEEAEEALSSEGSPRSSVVC